MWWSYRPYVSVAQKRANALREVQKLKKKGRVISPVEIDGRTIASTFWGKAWCDHLESFSDYENRLPRGRSYVRNGSVVDLQIQPGKVTALVAGSELYTVEIDIQPLAKAPWKSLCARCAGQVSSVIELLQGKLSASVMQVVTCRDRGLFPTPVQIKKRCSCPDWADMCKHVAAALYGVGARLDEQPELLFTLRNVDHLELIAGAGDVKAITRGDAGSRAKTLADDQLADVFGIDLAPGAPSQSPRARRTTDPSTRPTTSKTSRRAAKSMSADKPAATTFRPPAASLKASRKSPRAARKRRTARRARSD
ncbi:MAG TPA: SWIM zinc finger family protein [Tepidisphaeraceae bacterium]|jgi:uncharacterized Zn finger protein